ncbi:VOC family protein [Terrabacter sp. MAHUQ-38]|uniref:VOC family protein n=1 Tax=unclassified Terrabacter TaxID=2630222 RepID=UPI00165DD765|nr:VOC family protein [Terrabacter sp. MAHUQ-38]MBC9822604.1 VOC family protein [Terrabacter sp. MAHUQ-38]
MLRGLTTVNVFAHDVAAAVEWYTEVLGTAPYFVREVGGHLAYAEFRVGDYQHELGIVDARFAVARTPGANGPVTYWHVDDVAAAHDRLVTLGATPHEGVIERGPGYVTASVVDPFGNLIGVMVNQHYLDVLAARSA